ncbi:saccharopine dehydrogenase family protein [Pseudidiomarina sp. WS423]|uniref:saccharopine dehydrogenase family protein n=1 Tax=Pseudidiomarina sp. WS423 TaxID=3425124 RepID=UPI003D6F1583
MMQWMIYGANGYTGTLIAEQAVARGLQPILAGRNQAAIEALGERLELPVRVVDLADQAALHQALAEVDLVLHCAGPFELTAEPMIEACLATRTHYLDITGELAVFEYAHQQHQRAQAAGIVLCPGVGFDVIPTDCLAARLQQQLPDATHLTLGFDSASRMSRGTAKTSVRRLGEGGAIRQQGEIKMVPLAYKTRDIDFGGGSKLAMTIPWGDVATAFYSTGIGNVEVFIPASPNLVKRLKRLNRWRWLLRLNWVKNWLAKKIDTQPAGPDQQQLEQAHTYVWGEATNRAGDRVELKLTVMNGYKLTSLGALDVAQQVLMQAPEGGYYTPSKLLGPELVDRYLVTS